jgi:demethoxyubiquinone hydroxylase (CLK1/Coq7/Cat5 family)
MSMVRNESQGCDAVHEGGGDALPAPPLVVLYDGACPLCAREIAHYRGLPALQPLAWVDVSALPEGPVADRLTRCEALTRMHVVAPDGSVVSGARAFMAMWARLPRWRWLARVAAVPPLPSLLEAMYRGFLRLRPALKARLRAGERRWLMRELRSDHAGETGAVCIYRGILAVSRDQAVREFAQRHLATELTHLEAMEMLVPAGSRTRLLTLWRVAGWLTGALPAVAGPGAVYATIAAVESFVDRHYLQQIQRLPADNALREQLCAFRDDELHHRDEALQAAPSRRGWLLTLWCTVVGLGSEGAVVIARRV